MVLNLDLIFSLFLILFSSYTLLTLLEYSGPFDIIKKFKHVLGVRLDEFDFPRVPPEDSGFFEKLLYCFFCTSFWVVVPNYLVFLFFKDVEVITHIRIILTVIAGLHIIDKKVG